MDLLTDILQQAGLRRRLLDMQSLEPGIAMEFPCEKSIGMHVVTQGHAYIIAPEMEPMALAKGDIALMARGCTHFLSTLPSIENLPRVRLGTVQSVSDDSRFLSLQDPAMPVLVSGAYQLWHQPVHPLFATLPSWFVLRAESSSTTSPLALAIGLLESELSGHSLGSELIVHGLLDVIFTFALRRMVEDTPGAQAGWAVAVRDTHVHHAVQLMHQDCARAWSLGELAKAVGVSRTGLAAKFRETMGDTPLNYLRTLRIQTAMRILSDTQKTLETVATEVGYQDAFSFSKVFKRTVGISPREFRRKDLAEQATPWRFESTPFGAVA
jgi:AraC-like DNA-binding protein